nr:hypothetical protein [Tanacetum cinerariifolium]
ADDRRHRNTIADGFADAGQIRVQPFAQTGEAWVQAKAHQHLVADHQCAVLVSDVLHMFQIARQRHDAAGVGEHRFQNDCGDVLVFGEQSLHILEVVEAQQRGRRGTVCQGLGHGGVDRVIGVPEQDRAEAQRGVDVLAALVVPEIRALAVMNEQFLAVQFREDAGGAGYIAN